MSAEEVVPKAFLETLGKKGQARRLARRFLEIIDIEDIDPGVAQAATADILNELYTADAVLSLLMSHVPNYAGSERPYFRVYTADEWLRAETNIDLVKANAEYHKSVDPRHSSLSQAYLLSHILTVRETIDGASALQAEIVTDPTHSKLIALKMNHLAQRRIRSDANIAGFQDFAVDNVRAVREAINNKQRGIDDILRLLKRADRFKSWLAKMQPEANIIKEYHRECIATTWADRVPTKTARWALFTGAGLALDGLLHSGAGTALGVGVGALDTFVIDKLIKGWKPNHFVAKSLLSFVRPP